MISYVTDIITLVLAMARLMFAAVAPVLFILGAALLQSFPMSDAEHKQVKAELERRRDDGSGRSASEVDKLNGKPISTISQHAHATIAGCRGVLVLALLRNGVKARMHSLRTFILVCWGIAGLSSSEEPKHQPPSQKPQPHSNSAKNDKRDVTMGDTEI